MYLREMGGVELLSREGEIAIAKRIEAGKDVMLNALTQSPIVAKKISEWKEEIENQKILVRDIIDIDSTYEDFEASGEEDDDEENLKLKNKGKSQEKDQNKNNEENQKNDNTDGVTQSQEEVDEFNVSLAKNGRGDKTKNIKYFK